MEPLRIHLLGGFLLEHGTRPLPPIPSRAGRSLFAYLAVHRDRPHQRDYLAGIFWPELSEARARRRLSHVLWQIQDVLGEISGSSYLVATTDTLAFDRSAPRWLDVEQFELELTAASRREAEPDHLRRAVELYRGDFMAGFYDDWVVTYQELLRDRYLTSLTRLVEVEKARGNYQEALAFARRLTHHDPLREEAHQEVIRLCVLLGRTSEALQQYERCRSVLAEELGTEPSAATEELYQKILRHRHLSRPFTGQKTLFDEEIPFVGRDEERRLLVDAFESALGGRGGVVLMEGDPGVGKTRLASEAGEDARWRGFSVMWGGARETGDGPFASLSRALSSGLTHLRVAQLQGRIGEVWLREAARVVPELAGWLPESQRRTVDHPDRMTEALTSVLVGLGEIAPHLIVLDDFQWADPDTLGLLERLAPLLPRTRLVLAVIYRSEEARGNPTTWNVLRRLDRSAGLGRIMVAPFSVFEVGELIRRSLGLAHLDTEVAARLHRETGGNTLFTLETLRVLHERGLLDTTTGSLSPEAEVGRENIPVAPRVEKIINARIITLDEDARLLLETLAAAGTPLELGHLGEVTGLAQSTVLTGLDELTAKRLVREETGRYSVVHDQIRQVIYQAIPARSRMRLHRILAKTLLDAGREDPHLLARHFSAAGAHGPAARHHGEAGDAAAAVHAYASAAWHYTRAAEHARRARWSSSRRFELLGKLEKTLDVLARREEQRAVLDEMGSLADTDRAAAEVQTRRALLLAHTDDLQGALRVAEDAVASAGSLGDPVVEFRALLVLSKVLRWSGRSEEAAGTLKRAVQIASEPLQRAEAHTALATSLVELQRYQEAAEQAEAALSIVGATGDVPAEIEALGILAIVAMEQGDLSAAEGLYRRALELARRICYRHAEGVNLVNLANLCYFRGAIAEALSRYEEATDVFHGVANQRGEAIARANAAAVRHMVLGDDDTAEQEVLSAWKIFEEMGETVRVAQCQEVLASIRARAGEVEEARRLLHESLDTLAEVGNRWFEAQHLVSLARVEMADDRLEAALDALDRAKTICTELALKALQIEVDSLRAMVLSRRGDHAQALALSRDAVARLGGGTERPHLVWLNHLYITRRAGLDQDARRAAYRAYETLMGLLDGLRADECQGALERVPEHREIVQLYETSTPTRRTVRLPSADAPTGRPLRDDEFVVVTWTPETPEDFSISDPVRRRRHQVRRLLAEAVAQGAKPALADLAAALGVGSSTIRRDIAALRSEGLDVATRGQRSA